MSRNVVNDISEAAGEQPAVMKSSDHVVKSEVVVALDGLTLDAYAYRQLFLVRQHVPQAGRP
jgi:hypothetical protein